MTKEMLNIVRIVIKTVWEYYQETGELLSIKDFLAIPRMLGFPFFVNISNKKFEAIEDLYKQYLWQHPCLTNQLS